MCIAIGAAAAATMGTISSAVGAVTGVAGSILSITQAKQQAAYQKAQAEAAINNQVRQAENRNQERINQYVGEIAQRDANLKAYDEQLASNALAADAAYRSEQARLDEIRTKAAFKSQEAYAKSIGVKGQALASGRSGQSVGLMALDADRQQGFQQAEQDAMVKSAARAASVNMQSAANQQRSANNNAYNTLLIPVRHPMLEASPDSSQTLATPNYDWF